MDIPAEVKINCTLKQGFTYYFIVEAFNSSEPHYFVILNKNPLLDKCVIFVNATSKVNKAMRFQKVRNLPQESYVKVKKTECIYLTKDSVFDCNSVTKQSIQSLIEKVKDNKLKLKEKISDGVLKKLLNGVQKSPLVEENIKKMLS